MNDYPEKFVEAFTRLNEHKTYGYGCNYAFDNGVMGYGDGGLHGSGKGDGDGSGIYFFDDRHVHFLILR